MHAGSRKRNDTDSCDRCGAELQRILADEALLLRFLPVASLQECAVTGHLGLVSGPQDALLHLADHLFETAARFGGIERLTRAALSELIANFVREGGGGKLFLPLPAAAVARLGGTVAATIAKACEQSDLPRQRVIAILPWLGWEAQEEDRQRAADAAAALRDAGFAMAGTFGCPLSQELIGEATPGYLLLEDGRLDGVDPDIAAKGRLAEAVRVAQERGGRIVAMGVDGPRELRVAERLGIDLVAGDYIGRANTRPAQILSAASYKLIRQSQASDGPSPGETGHLLQRLRIEVSPVSRKTPAETVFATFERNPRLRAIAVVDDGIPAGLISRYEMIDNMARPYRHELYGRKSCVRFMDREPIVADIRLSLPELTEMFVHADPRHLVSGFIITDAGRYVGMGSVQDLMREITAMQIEAARYANPLTQLPGNVPISQHVDNLLAVQAAFAICYCDLDHFKPFNDVYGYARGDEVIALTARILAECCEQDTDFVGHVGGDDFVLVMRSADWVGRCQRTLALFEQEILGFFSPDDIERGGYVTANRKGEPEFHRLTALSIGAVEVAPGQFANHLQVAGIAAEVKKKAKAIAGNSLYVNHRHYGDGGEPPKA